MPKTTTGTSHRRKGAAAPKSTKADAERRLEEGLKGTFPASDPSQETQPHSGVTGLEPPPAGQKNAR